MIIEYEWHYALLQVAWNFLYHAEIQPQDVKFPDIKSKKALEKVKAAIQRFLKPFFMEVKDLVSLSNNATPLAIVTADVLKAIVVGVEAKAEFIST